MCNNICIFEIKFSIRCIISDHKIFDIIKYRGKNENPEDIDLCIANPPIPLVHEYFIKGKGAN